MTKTYKVVGAHNVYGHPPGATFRADLGDTHERHLITAGHIRVVEDAKPTKNEGGKD